MQCPKCHHEMSENCYLVDKAQSLSDFIVIEKDHNLKKTQYPIQVALCKHCGHIEFYTDIHSTKPIAE